MSNQQRKTLVIHPGIGKTATSTIQEIGISLDQKNPEQTCMCPYGIIGGAHNALATNHPLFKDGELKEIIKNTVDFIKNRNAPTLISSEFLIRQNPSDTRNLIKSFLDLNIEVFVFVGVRSYEELMLSSYLQAIKAQYGKLENETLQQYIDREIKSVRYPALIEPWAETAGKENILLFDFDKGRDSFVQQFFSNLDIDIQEKNLHTRKSNLSLPSESIDIVNAFDMVSSDRQSRAELLKILMSTQYKDGVKEIHKKTAKDACSRIYYDDYNLLSKNYKWAS